MMRPELEALLEECQERRAFFEHAAIERLRVIERGDELLRASADEILRLKQEVARLHPVAEERERFQQLWRETARGLEELANRERALTRENLELRNEGLLHSIIRRLSRDFS